MRILTLLLLAILPAFAFSHSGGKDQFGGHWYIPTMAYHCHPYACPSYRREAWIHWSDLDGDCLNTRHELLLEFNVGRISRSSCKVYGGRWLDKYTGIYYTFPSDLDVDHIVPLSWAHKRGGANWPTELKEKFANDPINLILIKDTLNAEKGARGPTEWMPPLYEYRCEYLARWQAVFDAYPLRMLTEEQAVFDLMRSSCISHYM